MCVILVWNKRCLYKHHTIKQRASIEPALTGNPLVSKVYAKIFQHCLLLSGGGGGGMAVESI